MIELFIWTKPFVSYLNTERSSLGENGIINSKAVMICGHSHVKWHTRHIWTWPSRAVTLRITHNTIPQCPIRDNATSYSEINLHYGISLTQQQKRFLISLKIRTLSDETQLRPSIIPQNICCNYFSNSFLIGTMPLLRGALIASVAALTFMSPGGNHGLVSY